MGNFKAFSAFKNKLFNSKYVLNNFMMSSTQADDIVASVYDIFIHKHNFLI
jgi:hypothetical protein